MDKTFNLSLPKGLLSDFNVDVDSDGTITVMFSISPVDPTSPAPSRYSKPHPGRSKEGRANRLAIMETLEHYPQGIRQPDLAKAVGITSISRHLMDLERLGKVTRFRDRHGFTVFPLTPASPEA